jgi:hypothetical protein
MCGIAVIPVVMDLEGKETSKQRWGSWTAFIYHVRSYSTHLDPNLELLLTSHTMTWPLRFRDACQFEGPQSLAALHFSRPIASGWSPHPRKQTHFEKSEGSHLELDVGDRQSLALRGVGD